MEYIKYLTPPKCSGCYPIRYANQQAHMDKGGCLYVEIKYDDDFQMTIDKFVHRPCVYCGVYFLYEYALLKDHKPDNYVCDKCTHIWR